MKKKKEKFWRIWALVMGLVLLSGTALAEEVEIKKGENIIVLQIDSLQGLVLDLEYEGQEITPNLNRLKEDSIFFENYYEMTGIGDSGDAEFVSNNSLMPDRNFISYFKYEDRQFNGLPKILKSQGFKTYLMTNNEGKRFNRDRVFKGQGFDAFYSKEDFSSGEEIGFSLNDGQYFQEALGKIADMKQKDEKIYLYMSNGSSQKPFSIGEKFKGIKMNSKDRGGALDGYLNSMNYVDRQIGEFIEGLKDLGIYEETSLIIQGTGSGLPLSHEKTKKRVEELIGRPYNYKELLNTPLIIHRPGEEARRIGVRGSHLDFMPTVMGLLGLETDSPVIFGENLLDFQGNRPISLDKYRAKSFIKDDKIFWMGEEGRLEDSQVFSLGKGQYNYQNLEPDYRKFSKSLRDSKYILENDLIEELEAGLSLEDVTDYRNLIDINALYSINDFRRLYDEGYEYFRIALDNFRAFMSTLDEFGDIKYLVPVSEENYKELEDIPERYRKDMEIEVLWNFDKALLDEIREMGYEDLVVNIYGGDLEKLEDFNFKGIVLDKKNMESKDFEEIKNTYRTIVKAEEYPVSRQMKKKEFNTVLSPALEVLERIGKRDVLNKQLVAHAGGRIGGISYTNTKEAMLDSYETGLRLMEIDFDWTTDRKLAGTHDWKGVIPRFFNMPEKRYSLEEFKNFEMINSWTQLTLESIEELFNQYPDMQLVTDVKYDNIEALAHIKEEFPFLEGKVIPQVYRFPQYEQAKILGYDEIILTLYVITETYDDIVEFADQHRPFAITMPINMVRDGLANRLREKGIYTYTHTVNKLELVEEMEGLGVLGIYTDSIRP